MDPKSEPERLATLAFFSLLHNQTDSSVLAWLKRTSLFLPVMQSILERVDKTDDFNHFLFNPPHQIQRLTAELLSP